ncbi:MAG: cytochrome P450 [Chloroflexota bacterium]
MLQATTPDMLFDVQPRPCPRLKGWPIIGNIPGLMRSSYSFFEQMYAEYGDIYTLNLGLSQIIVCNHPRHIQHVLLDNAQNYVKGGPLWSVLRDLIGNGLVTSEGDFWLRQRRMMQPQFHKKRLEALASLMTSAIADELASWSVPSDSSDMAHAFNQLTMRVIVRTMFGTALSAAQMNEVADAVPQALDYIMRGMLTSKLPSWIPDPKRRAFEQSIAVFDGAVYQMIDEQRHNPKKENHLLAMLLDVVDAETGEGMTDQQLRDEAITIFLAGFETTSTALSWSVYYLSQHPDIQNKLEQEVDAVLGPRTPTFDDLPNLPYARMVLQEAIRLRPSAWFGSRQAVEDDVIDGYSIPAGSEVATMTYMIHRHPEEWDNADQFIPERFTPEASAKRHRWAWVPFGAGQRMCIGREFALMEGQLALAMMAQRFRPSAIEGYEPQLRLSTTFQTKSGLRVKLSER